MGNHSYMSAAVMSSLLAHAALALSKATALHCRVLTLPHSEALSSHHLYLSQIKERKRIYQRQRGHL